MFSLFRCRFVFSLLLLSSFLCLSGCVELPFLFSGDDGPYRPPVAEPTALDRTRAALAEGNYSRAEVIAQRESVRTDLDPANRAELSHLLAVAALRNKHPNTALNALNAWLSVAPGADLQRVWQEIWCEALSGISPFAAKEKAEALYQDGGRNPAARSMAGIFLAVRQWEEGKTGETMAALEYLYSAAQDAKAKAGLEWLLARRLLSADPAASNTALSAVTEENQRTFPYSIILIDALRRQAAVPETGAAARERLQTLSLPLAERSLLKNPPETAIILPMAAVRYEGNIKGQAVVLALPLSGAMGNFSAKIAAGAGIACNELTAQGRPTSLITIDTDKPDWIARISGLPADIAVIGGPMRPGDYSALRGQGVTSGRAFFAFLPNMEAGDEGRSAWRFFYSGQDQIEALLKYTESLNIHSYAAFYPEEAYGSRMASEFQAKASARGSTVHMMTYPAAQPSQWLRSVGNFVAENVKTGKSAFQAVFLPDSWRNMDVIVPNMFYYDESTQILLGTALWEQGIASGGFVRPDFFTLAVFPGAWNSAAPPPAAQRLQSSLQASGKGTADFWSGLGYDFARFSAMLQVKRGWTPDSINSLLQSTRPDWSMAPLRWTPDGKAHQEMYLFTPVEGGFVPLNDQHFREAYKNALKRKQERR